MDAPAADPSSHPNRRHARGRGRRSASEFEQVSGRPDGRDEASHLRTRCSDGRDSPFAASSAWAAPISSEAAAAPATLRVTSPVPVAARGTSRRISCVAAARSSTAAPLTSRIRPAITPTAPTAPAVAPCPRDLTRDFRRGPGRLRGERRDPGGGRFLAALDVVRLHDPSGRIGPRVIADFPAGRQDLPRLRTDIAARSPVLPDLILRHTPLGRDSSGEDGADLTRAVTQLRRRPDHRQPGAARSSPRSARSRIQPSSAPRTCSVSRTSLT